MEGGKIQELKKMGFRAPEKLADWMINEAREKGMTLNSWLLNELWQIYSSRKKKEKED